MRPRTETGGRRSMKAWPWLLLTTCLFFMIWYFTWPSAGVETTTTREGREEDSSQDAPSLQKPPSSLSLAGEIPVVSITFGECKGGTGFSEALAPPFHGHLSSSPMSGRR